MTLLVLLNSKPSNKFPAWCIWLPWIWTRTLSLEPGTGCKTELAWTWCCRAVATAAGSKPYNSRFFIRVTFNSHTLSTTLGSMRHHGAVNVSVLNGIDTQRVSGSITLNQAENITVTSGWIPASLRHS